jgi:hypothetical protein
MAVKVVVAFIVVVGLAGGTVYYMSARSKAATSKLPPLTPTADLLSQNQPGQTTAPTPTPTVPETPIPTTPETNPAAALPPRDTDGDGLTDDQEKQFGTDPTSKDTDGDALSDYEEVITYGTNPLKKDTDADGLTDFDELKLWKTDPKKADTDGDSFPDKTEIDNGYNPLGTGKLTDAQKTLLAPVPAPAVTPSPTPDSTPVAIPLVP